MFASGRRARSARQGAQAGLARGPGVSPDPMRSNRVVATDSGHHPEADSFTGPGERNGEVGGPKVPGMARGPAPARRARCQPPSRCRATHSSRPKAGTTLKPTPSLAQEKGDDGVGEEEALGICFIGPIRLGPITKGSISV